MDEIEFYIEQVLVQPRVRGQLLVAMTYECKADEDEEECESQEGDDQSERAEDVQHDGHGVFEFMDEENNNVNVVSSFLALHEAMESEEGRYVSVDGEGCEISNNPNPKDLMEFFPVQHHSTPSLQFENVENIGNVVSSDWTPWGNTNIGNSCGEFMERLHVGRLNFGRPLAPPAAQHLNHDTTDDLPVEGPIRVHHELLDKDQGLQDEALLDEGLLVDPLGCDIHRIAIDILHVIGEEHYQSMRPLVSATIVRMQPIRGRGRGSRRDGGRVG
ncbi:hypothetical protein AAG906_011099 [Vitis piasezkii]